MANLPEKFKVYGNVFDEFTLHELHRLSSQGLFEDLHSSISLGKEANIFTAKKKDGSLVVVKIYRLQSCNFNKMWSYLQSDPRFKGTKPRRREIIFAWVKREYRNLLKAREAGIRVPTPYTFSAHILVEEYVEDNDKPAPKLKDTELEDPRGVESEIFSMMKKLYKSGLVHADLSAFNILMQYGQPVFIDMSQSTEVKDQMAQDYLIRDVSNLCTFFRIKDVEKAVAFVKGTSKSYS